MGGYEGFEKVMLRKENYTVISDSLKKEFSEMPDERKDKVIKLLQAKVRMLEQTLINENNRYEYEQAEEDRKFFLDYRADGEVKISDAMREAVKNASDNIDQYMASEWEEYAAKCAADGAKKNILDRNVMFDEMFGIKTDKNGNAITIAEEQTIIASEDLPDFSDFDPNPILDPYPTKVTLVEDVNKGSERLSLTVERLGNVGIVVNKKTHKIVYSNENENSVTITFERK